MDLKKILQKIDKIFGILGLYSEEQMELDFIISTVRLALVKTAERDQTIKEKLVAINLLQIRSGNFQSVSEFYNFLEMREKQSIFINELKLIIEEYIRKINPTINNFKRKQIQSIWASV